MSPLRPALLALLIGLPASLAAAQTIEVKSLGAGETSPPASLDDIAWMVGHWTGEGLGGTSKEVLAPPAGGQMMGMFRQLDAGGALQFYEFYSFAEEDGSLVLRLKHFNPDLTGWEEKDEMETFRLVALEGQTAWFDGITYSMTAPGEMTAAVQVGGPEPTLFIYKKTD